MYILYLLCLTMSFYYLSWNFLFSIVLQFLKHSFVEVLWIVWIIDYITPYFIHFSLSVDHVSHSHSVCLATGVMTLVSSSETPRQCDSPTQKMCPLSSSLSSSLTLFLLFRGDHSMPEVLGSVGLPCWWTFLVGTIQASVHLRLVPLSVRRWVGQRTVGWGEGMRSDAWTRCVLRKGWHEGG